MAIPICEHLRTKKNYVPALQDRDFLEEQDPYLQYFCVKTLPVVGPDDGMVCPGACTAARRCFQQRVRRGLV